MSELNFFVCPTHIFEDQFSVFGKSVGKDSVALKKKNKQLTSDNSYYRPLYSLAKYFFDECVISKRYILVL